MTEKRHPRKDAALVCHTTLGTQQRWRARAFKVVESSMT